MDGNQLEHITRDFHTLSVSPQAILHQQHQLSHFRQPVLSPSQNCFPREFSPRGLQLVAFYPQLMKMVSVQLVSGHRGDTRIHMHMHIHAHTYIRACKYICRCTYTYTWPHTHTHVHMYTSQEDLLFGFLTVEESIRFAAGLQLPGGRVPLARKPLLFSAPPFPSLPSGGFHPCEGHTVNSFFFLEQATHQAEKRSTQANCAVLHAWGLAGFSLVGPRSSQGGE